MLACIGVKANLTEHQHISAINTPNVTDLSTLSSTKYYVLYNVVAKQYITVETAEGEAYLTENIVDNLEASACGSIFQFEKITDTENQFKIKSALFDRYFADLAGAGTNDNRLKLTENNDAAGTFTLESLTDGKFALKGTHYLHYSGQGDSKLNSWLDDTGGNDEFEIYEVTLSTSFYEVTYNYSFYSGGELIGQKSIVHEQGSNKTIELPLVTKGYVDVQAGEITTGEDGKLAVAVRVDRNYPFTFNSQTDGTVDAGGTWYTMLIDRVGSNGINAIYNNDEGNTYCQNDLQVGAGYIWCFVPADDYVGIKVCNLLDGNYLKQNGNVIKCDASFVEATSFLPAENGNGFNLVLASDPTTLIGDHLNGWGDNLSTWENGDSGNEGNRFSISEISRDDYMIFSGLVNKEAEYVGECQANETLVAAQATYASSGKATSDLSAYVSAYKANLSSVGTPVRFNTADYYRIISRTGEAYPDRPNPKNQLTTKDAYFENGAYYGVYNNDPQRKVNRVAEDKHDMAALWQLRGWSEEGKKAYIVNANMDRCLGGYDSGNNSGYGSVTLQGYAPQYLITNNDGPTSFYLQDSRNNRYLNTDGGQETDRLAFKDGTPDLGDKWKFQRVTEVPVAIGAKGWASLVLPFAVVLPEDVTAYIATAEMSAEGKLELVEYSNVENGVNVLPAQVSVFLYSETAGEKMLTITTSAAEKPANVLKGLTVRDHNANKWGGYFGLKKDENYLISAANLEFLPANRAFVTATTNVREIMLEFGDATGIEEMPAAQLTEEVYYDLSGRRVWTPKNGIFVTASGKKVFIK